ncbi:unnamed protein product [Polarella glacialis]|uniref:Sulfatase N-terminal domain-containing protein n=1 Tax=Polarella glacialis TaxID=89957 RepID=A0A813HBW8_POLGL|nr:unnamed protein product [Polarella glacialis]CAE8716733.1 unnamed protein product [Polarella glacialis]
MMSRSALVAFAAFTARAWAVKPNLVFILVDDWGWNNVGYHRPNTAEVSTPNIDKLVREGIELDRHYTYHYCSPSRSSLQSGRMAVHVAYGQDDPLLVNKADPDSGFNGIPRNMTGVAEKLRAAGYRTHMTGKWDAGMATWEHTPMGRGYETFFGYYHHANDYWTQRLSDSDLHGDICGNLVDLWNTTGPARDRNGTAYVEELFTENTLGIIERHDPAEPLFLFHSFHLVHTPLQVPASWEQEFGFLTNDAQRKYAAMTAYMDDVTGQIVRKLEEKNMWENTLLVMSSDNGGPTYNIPPLGPGAANNAPLRGGKMSDWEGGIRVNAFVSGGAIPLGKRGSILKEFVHMADWYTTFCSIAGVDSRDEKAATAGLPPVDGIDHSQLLIGDAKPGSGKRTEIHHSARALLQGQWKLITGGIIDLEILQRDNYSDALNFGGPLIPYSDYLTGYEAPPETLEKGPRSMEDCSAGCLYDVLNDPNEHEDVAKKHPEVVAELKARLKELNSGIFHKYRGTADVAGCTPWNGFYGPFIDTGLHADSTPATSTEMFV